MADDRPGSVPPLRESLDGAASIFWCNTDRGAGAGGNSLEQRMHARGFAAAWLPFVYEDHMRRVRGGEVIVMYANGLGVIGIGRAAESRLEILGPDHPDRLRPFASEGENEEEWRIPVQDAQFGYAYVSTGRKLDPAASMPPFLTALIERGLSHCPECTQFNQCIVTSYPEGTGIAWHTDAPRFGDCIMAVSLGGDARLQFRPSGSEGVRHELLASPGSLYVLSGPARWEYQHQVVPVKSARYSLTFCHVPAQEAGQASSKRRRPAEK